MWLNLNPNNTNPCVYFTYCFSDNSVYVGEASNYTARINQTYSLLSRGKYHNLPLQATYDKYGESNFISGIIQTFSNIDINRLPAEKYYIKLLNIIYKVLNKDISSKYSIFSLIPGLDAPFTKFKSDVFLKTFSSTNFPMYSLCLPITTLDYLFNVAMTEYASSLGYKDIWYTLLLNPLSWNKEHLSTLPPLLILYLLFPKYFILEYILHYSSDILIDTPVKDTYLKLSSKEIIPYLFNNNKSISSSILDKRLLKMTHNNNKILLSSFPFPNNFSSYMSTNREYTGRILVDLTSCKNQLTILSNRIFSPYIPKKNKSISTTIQTGEKLSLRIKHLEKLKVRNSNQVYCKLDQMFYSCYRFNDNNRVISLNYFKDMISYLPLLTDNYL